MKTIVRLSSLLFLLAIIFTGCVKTIDRYEQNDYPPIEGSWILNNAAKGNAYGWQPLYTGFENGIFTFYNNGAANYRDSYGTYSGTWYIATVYNGTYYDYNGNVYTDVHETFEVNLRDAYGKAIHLYFDDINFSNGNYFTTTYYKSNAIERYRFSRY